MVKDIATELEGLDNRMQLEYSKHHHCEFQGRLPGKQRLFNSLMKEWEESQSGGENQVSESEVAEWRRKFRQLSLFVVSPVDKLPAKEKQSIDFINKMYSEICGAETIKSTSTLNRSSHKLLRKNEDTLNNSLLCS